MGIGALIGGAVGLFASGGNPLGGIVGAVGGLFGLAATGMLGGSKRESAAQQAQVSKEQAQSGAGRNAVAEARRRRASAAQLQTAQSFDGVGNENGKIPFVRSDQNAPLGEQQSIFN